MSAAFTEDSQWIISGSADKDIQIWEAITRDAVLRIRGHACGTLLDVDSH